MLPSEKNELSLLKNASGSPPAVSNLHASYVDALPLQKRGYCPIFKNMRLPRDLAACKQNMNYPLTKAPSAKRECTSFTCVDMDKNNFPCRFPMMNIHILFQCLGSFLHSSVMSSYFDCMELLVLQVFSSTLTWVSPTGGLLFSHKTKYWNPSQQNP